MWDCCLFKELFPVAEAPEPFLSKLGEAMLCLTDGLLLLETCLGEELVGIADDLFL